MFGEGPRFHDDEDDHVIREWQKRELPSYTNADLRQALSNQVAVTDAEMLGTVPMGLPLPHERLLELAGGRVPVLCCFERSAASRGRGSGWCHRALASRWLSDGLGIAVPELGTRGWRRTITRSGRRR
jgi:hypothetical protein